MIPRKIIKDKSHRRPEMSGKKEIIKKKVWEAKKGEEANRKVEAEKGEII